RRLGKGLGLGSLLNDDIRRRKLNGGIACRQHAFQFTYVVLGPTFIGPEDEEFSSLRGEVDPGGEAFVKLDALGTLELGPGIIQGVEGPTFTDLADRHGFREAPHGRAAARVSR